MPVQPTQPVNGEDTPGAPLSWRDVYKAVGDSETRIIAAVNSAVEPLTKGMADHEARLRELETHGSPEAREALTRLGLLESAVGPLAALAADRDRRLGAVEAITSTNRDAINDFIARERGVFSTLGVGKSVLLAMAAIVSPALAIIALVTSGQ